MMNDFEIGGKIKPDFENLGEGPPAGIVTY
jgi:hypothetical protein